MATKNEKIREDIWVLYSIAMKLLLEKEAKYKWFLTNKEFSKNAGVVYVLSGARQNAIKNIGNEKENEK